MPVRNKLYCGECWETRDSESEFARNMKRCLSCQRQINRQYNWRRRGKPKPRKTIEHRRARKTHYQNMRRASQLKATPAWANLAAIAEIYATAKKGQHVDHIVPLCGKNVCGLHVENNLQILSMSENCRKSNRP